MSQYVRFVRLLKLKNHVLTQKSETIETDSLDSLSKPQLLMDTDYVQFKVHQNMLY